MIFEDFDSVIFPCFLLSESGKVVQLNAAALKKFDNSMERANSHLAGLNIDVLYSSNVDDIFGMILYAESYSNVTLLSDEGKPQNLTGYLFEINLPKEGRKYRTFCDTLNRPAGITYWGGRESYLDIREKALSVMNVGLTAELRNLLGVITGYAEMVSESVVVESTAAQDLQELLSICSKGQKLLSRVSDLGRMKEIVLLESKPEKCFEEIVEMLRMILPKRVNFQYVSESSNRIFITDPHRLQQIVLGICACLFVGDKSLVHCDEIIVLLTDEQADQGWILKEFSESLKRIEIKITGKKTGDLGLSKINIERSSEDVPLRRYSEMIAFLFVVKELVEPINGKVRMFYAENRISLNLNFPVAEKPLVKSPKFIGPPLGNGEIIFVVDDELSVATLTKTRLEKFGYKVVARTNSREALSYYSQNHKGIDVMITDQVMPDMAGMVLASEVLKINPDIPIIMMTGYSSGITSEMCFEKGIKFLAMKPLDEKELATIVSKALGNFTEGR